MFVPIVHRDPCPRNSAGIQVVAFKHAHTPNAHTQHTRNNISHGFTSLFFYFLLFPLPSGLTSVSTIGSPTCFREPLVVLARLPPRPLPIRHRRLINFPSRSSYMIERIDTVNDFFRLFIKKCYREMLKSVSA